MRRLCRQILPVVHLPGPFVTATRPNGVIRGVIRGDRATAPHNSMPSSSGRTVVSGRGCGASSGTLPSIGGDGRARNQEAGAASSGVSDSVGGSGTERAVTLLDRSMFDTTIHVPAIRVPCQECSSILKRLRPFVLKKAKVRPVVRVPPPASASGSATGGERCTDDKARYILLKCEVGALPKEMWSFASERGAEEVAEPYPVKLSYINFNVASVLRRALPSHVLIPVRGTEEGQEGSTNAGVPGSFEAVGHIAHLNLRKHQV